MGEPQLISRAQWFQIWLILANDGIPDRAIAEEFGLDRAFVAELRYVDSLPAWERNAWLVQSAPPLYRPTVPNVSNARLRNVLLVSLIANVVLWFI